MQIAISDKIPRDTYCVDNHGKRRGISIRENGVFKNTHHIDMLSLEWYFENEDGLTACRGPSVYQISPINLAFFFRTPEVHVTIIPKEAANDIYQKIALYPYPIPMARIIARRIWDKKPPVKECHPWKARDHLIIFLALEHGLTLPALESIVCMWGDYDQSLESYRKFLKEKGHLKKS